MINPLTHRKILEKGRPGRVRITALTWPERGALSEAELEQEKRRLLDQI
jgi:hypothetical protein